MFIRKLTQQFCSQNLTESYRPFLQSLGSKQQEKLNQALQGKSIQQIEPIQQLIQQYQLNKQTVQKMLNINPHSLVADDSKTINLMRCQHIFNQYQFTNKNIATIINKEISIFELSDDQIIKSLNQIKETLQAEDKLLQHIVLSFPRVLKFHPHIIRRRLQNIVDYLKGDNNLAKRLIEKYPWMVILQQSQITNSFKFLYYIGFNKQKTFEMIYQNEMILFKSEKYLRLNYNFVKKHGIQSNADIRKFYLKYPQFISMDQSNILSKYDKLLSRGELAKTPEEFAQIFQENFETIYQKSIGSLQLKINYILQQGGDLTQNQFLNAIQLSYSDVIRPRGQLMKKFKSQFKYDLLICTEEEFCQQLNITQEQVDQIKKQWPVKDEYDRQRNPITKKIL